MRFPPSDEDTCHSANIIDLFILDNIKEILPLNHVNSIEPILDHLPEIHEDCNNHALFAANYNDDEKPTSKLKELPSHLEYAFLDDNRKLPVVISLLLSSQKKKLLLEVLTKHKKAMAWKISDIKGISTSFCTHKTLMEENSKPTVQPQHRLNPKVQDVVKTEILKLLDAGLIYAISDSPWHQKTKKRPPLLVPMALLPTEECLSGYVNSLRHITVMHGQNLPDMSFDYVSKWVEAESLPTNDARVVVKFLRKLFSRFGVPKALISDRGTHFCNSLLEKTLKKYRVTYRLATPYHPQTSGQTENTNRAINRILERTVDRNRKEWADKLDDALWAFRTAYKTPIGKHRFLQLNQLDEFRTEAYEHSRAYKERTKRWHDSKIMDKEFQEGEE
ncbi:reverse transcriptase domain-containing protein, partial [Tanacetum coccineum]